MPSSGHFGAFLLSKPQLNHNSNQPQPNLTKVGFYVKMSLHTTKKTPCPQYLICYWHYFDDILKAGSLENLEQISTVIVTFVEVTFVLVTLVHIRNISPITDPILA